jgi:hypothetical protein
MTWSLSTTSRFTSGDDDNDDDDDIIESAGGDISLGEDIQG